MATANDVPPKLIKGKGIPVSGMRPEMAAIFTAACIVIQVVNPKPSSLSNSVDAFFEILYPNQQNIKNKKIIIIAPANPVSSAAIANIESPNGSGR